MFGGKQHGQQVRSTGTCQLETARDANHMAFLHRTKTLATPTQARAEPTPAKNRHPRTRRRHPAPTNHLTPPNTRPARLRTTLPRQINPPRSHTHLHQVNTSNSNNTQATARPHPTHRPPANNTRTILPLHPANRPQISMVPRHTEEANTRVDTDSRSTLVRQQEDTATLHMPVSRRHRPVSRLTLSSRAMVVDSNTPDRRTTRC
jgi:hypothetical protein